MAAFVLIMSGSFAMAWGLVHGYLSARAALEPFASEGEPTRVLIDASRPLHERQRVRKALRLVVVAMVWLVVAMYGLFLASVGVEVFR